MPATHIVNTGDGIFESMINAVISEPDGNGGSVAVSGVVQVPGNPAVTISGGGALTAPAAPTAGSLWWNINVDYLAGTATLQQSTLADPAPTGTGLIIFRETLTTATTSDSADPMQTTPDTY